MNIPQIIEYNMRNTFLENQKENVVEKLVPDPFIKKSRLYIYLD